MRPHPRGARTNPRHPEGWATCQRCGFIYNLVKLQTQMDWRGMQLMSTNIQVCPPCLDDPQRQLGGIVLSADPPPLAGALPEPYLIDEYWPRLVQGGQPRYLQGGRARYLQTSNAPATVISQAPQIISISSSTGYTGDVITITGLHFSSVTQVLFEGIPASFTILNDQTIIVTVP